MPDLGIHDEDVSTFSRLLDVFLRNEPKPERRHAFLTFVRNVIDLRLQSAAREVEIERRRARSATPPVRPISQTMPAATAPTERHNTARLVQQAEQERDLEEARELEGRDTPLTAFEPGAYRIQHPDRER